MDAERPLARTHRGVAEPRILRPGVWPPERFLLWAYGTLLDWPPLRQHLAGLLHRRLPAAAARRAGPVHRNSVAGDRRLLCDLSAGRQRVPVDTRGACRRHGDTRLCVWDLPLRRAAFRSAFSLPRAGRTRACQHTRRLDRVFALGAGGVLIFV